MIEAKPQTAILACKILKDVISYGDIDSARLEEVVSVARVLSPEVTQLLACQSEVSFAGSSLIQIVFNKIFLLKKPIYSEEKAEMTQLSSHYAKIVPQMLEERALTQEGRYQPSFEALI